MDIIFDIDGTLANNDHRLHYIRRDKPNWQAFFFGRELLKDTPIEETWKILTALLAEHNRIVFVTGRPEYTRDATYRWLRDGNCVHRAIADHYWRQEPSSHQPTLFMRGNEDRRPSAEVKRDLLEKVREYYDPRVAFEDRAGDAAMWRAEGLLCYQIRRETPDAQ